MRVTLEKDVHLVEEDEVKLPRIYYVWHTPALYAPGDAEMDVLASVLTGGKSSRLYKVAGFWRESGQGCRCFPSLHALGQFLCHPGHCGPRKVSG